MNNNRIAFKIYTFLLLTLGWLVNACTTNAQSTNLTKAYKVEVIQKLSKELKDRYVFPKIADQITENLNNLEQKGHFDKFKQLNDFSEALTQCAFTISNDKHIIISLKKQQETIKKEENINTNKIESRLEERTYYRRYNANFKSVTKMDGNIGYLDLRGFYGLDYGRDFANHAMAMLSTSDAIIIDLRNNSGGRGDMVDYLLSYFFDKPIITGKSIKRRGDEFVERTQMSPENNQNKKLTETPLFILTSTKTFSAAEAFSYPLKVYKRAIFIGETTKGGGNAGDIISINKELEVFIPDVAAIPHPISNTTFEGIGIIPDIKIKSIKALDVAMKHAKIAAEKHKSKMDEKAKTILQSTIELVTNFDGKSNQQIIDAYLKCRKYDVIFEEWELINLGYQLLAKQNLKTALAIFKTNIILYPHSANAHDSYAEALVKNGEIGKGVLNYEKAVSIAEINNDQYLKVFKENLLKARKALNKK